MADRRDIAMRRTGRDADLVPQDLGVIAERLGSGLREATFVSDGGSMVTFRIALDDGRVFAAQRLVGGAAPRRAVSAAAMADRLAAAGIPVPSPVTIVPIRRIRWLASAWADGESGRAWLDTPQRARRLAAEMGALTTLLAGVGAADVDLDRAWETPSDVERATMTSLARLGGSLGPVHLRSLRDAAGVISTSLVGAVPTFAHGDLAPVNVILGRDGAIRAVLDLEAACRAVPLLDVAWWGWIVRFHHPEAWAWTWPVFLEAAGVGHDAETSALVEALQRLRCLDMAARARTERSRRAWLIRLGKTLAWEPAAGSRER